MSPEPIPVRSVPTLECRNCGAGAPVDEHFCRGCSRILALGRHGDYFSFFGLGRKLTIDAQDLERRFRDLSRKFHPDFYYNATPSERLASLERSSYLNDAYRTLRNPVARVEHLLAIEGLQLADSKEGGTHVPPSLLEEVFALNEELDEIRELREAGADGTVLRVRLDGARTPIESRRDEHERQLQHLCALWDSQGGASPSERRATLDALRECVLERNYINNLLATIEREVASAGLGAEDTGLGEAEDPRPEFRRG
jgi:molecular chaperone HscB